MRSLLSLVSANPHLSRLTNGASGAWWRSFFLTICGLWVLTFFLIALPVASGDASVLLLAVLVGPIAPVAILVMTTGLTGIAARTACHDVRSEAFQLLQLTSLPNAKIAWGYVLAAIYRLRGTTRLVIGFSPILVFMLGMFPFILQMDEGVSRCGYSILGNYYCTPQERPDAPTSEQINTFALLFALLYLWTWPMASTIHVVGLMLLSMTAASGLALKSRNCALPVLGFLVVMLPCVLFVLIAVIAEGFFIFWVDPPSAPRFLLTVGGFAAAPWILTYAMGRVAARWVHESKS